MSEKTKAYGWQSMDSAPTDGTPIWVRGNNFGDFDRGQHCLWAYYEWIDQASGVWREATTEVSHLKYLTEWYKFP